jgi:predicted CXXCH cytochrome family protein
MSRKKKSHRARAAHHARDLQPVAAPADAAASGRRRTRLVLGAVVLLLIAGGLIYARVGRQSPPVATAPPSRPVAAPAATHVGAHVCAACHVKEYEAWQGSHHALAMQHANAQTVLGNFDHAQFTDAGITSTFFTRDGKFFVNTDGPDGTLHDYEIKYTFGITPLQQYLIEFPDGRLQALTIAWDTRPTEAGGQRWFHLYPGQAITAGDRLHWTGIDQNWNFMCAECHSTDVHKNFDAETNRFATQWSEINVACEACHGPGSVHVAWTKKEGGWKHVDGPGRGLQVALDERRGITWTPQADTGNAVRSRPREAAREVEMCGRCHARRGQLTDRLAFGRSLSDTHRVSLIEAPLYWPDGQMREEVYNYGSFLQSKMFAQGVTCSDCHDPHTQKLKASGNAVCAQCHLPAKYDTPQHHHHEAGSKGAECAACHIPTTIYMVVDPRHDHSLHIPRPDRSVTLGTPNACNQCHEQQTPEWAADQVRKWYPQPLPGYQRFAEALHAGSAMAAGARDQLLKVANDPSQPAIARASAIARLSAHPGPAMVNAVVGALHDDSPLVRRAAVEVLAATGPDTRIRFLPRLLEDPVKSVRLEAARALAALPPDRIPAAQRAALLKGVEEYVAVQQFNADRPEAHGNLGTLHAQRGAYEQAKAEYLKALELDPAFLPAAVNLADLYRFHGHEQDAEAVLRDALRRNPDAAAYYALGLSLVRQRRRDEAVVELREAARLAPNSAQYAYVYGMALHSTGKPQDALHVLEAAHQRFPADPAILQALATMERDRGNREAALAYARQLAHAAPDDPAAQALLQEMERR